MDFEDYKKAGKFNKKILETAKKKVKVGAKLLDVAEELEGMAREEGLGLAFPINISINEAAAHDTPSIDDERVFEEKDLIKIDSGIHSNGYIADSAITIDLSGENGKLIEASIEALNNAISILRDGVNISDIGKEIESTINRYGFRPIENLTGHVMARYNLHAGVSIPNISLNLSHTLNEGDVIAIEPFVTPGKGKVNDGPRVEIFMYQKDRPLRSKEAREMLSYIKEKFLTLPFAERWLMKKFEGMKYRIGLQELVRSGSIKTYPILKEVSGNLVSQAEHTIIIQKEGCEVTT